METAQIALEAQLSPGVWTDLWPDVLASPTPTFEYGIQGTGPSDLVAGTGRTNFALKNGKDNTGRKIGYYSPRHPDVRSGWDESTKVRFKFTYAGVSRYKFVGLVSSVDPEAGLFGRREVDVEAVDWMDQAAAQKISQLAIQTSKRVDQVLPTIVSDMPIAPRATSYATGQETFSRLFDTDNDEKMSPMALFSKLARNEYGLIYLKGDTAGGETLRFDSRHTRALNQTVLVTLDNSMQELEIEYSREAVKNLVKTSIYPKKVDAAATTVLYELQKPFSIPPGQTVTLVLPYRDPTSARPISATDVVSPLVADTGFKFGSTEGTANDLNASFGQSAIIGGNSTRLAITNNASVTGWVNILKLHGKGIYPYDPLTFEAKDQTSINKRGELALTFELEQHDSPVKGEAFAAYLKNRNSVPQKVIERVRFLANQSPALMAAALDGEPSSRIHIKESVTAIDADYFINGVHFEIVMGKWIFCEWIVVPADTTDFFIWNTSRWNVDTYWAF